MPTLSSFKRMSQTRSAGFTLLELLIVLAIIGLLVGYVGPRFFGQLEQSEIKVARAQIRGLEQALEQYRIDVGRFPTSEQGLEALNTPPPGARNWQGPYLKKAVPLDPWGSPYQLRAPGQFGEIDIYSFGRDGQPGGSGDDADIGNWQ